MSLQYTSSCKVQWSVGISKCHLSVRAQEIWPVNKNKAGKIEFSSYFQLLTHLGPSVIMQG